MCEDNLTSLCFWQVFTISSPPSGSEHPETLFQAMANTRKHPTRSHVRLTIRPIHPMIQRWKRWQLSRLKKNAEHTETQNLQDAHRKLQHRLYSASLKIRVAGEHKNRSVLLAKLREIAGSFGMFNGPRARFREQRYWWPRFLLSTEEVAALWHPPTLGVQAPNVNLLRSRDRSPPLDLPQPQTHPNVTLIGVTKFRIEWKKIGILPDDRFRHLALLGKTGMGKTTLLHRLIASDIQAGHGVCVMDPHGDLISHLLTNIPKQRTNDVILFDPADTVHPLAFNLLAHVKPTQRPLVASGIVTAFKKLYKDSWGPRMEHYLRNALLVLLDVPGTSLISLARFLNDARFRNELVPHAHNPAVRYVWEREFAGKSPRDQQDYISPIQNKLSQFLSYPALCHIVGQPTSKLHLRQVMDDGHILLCNLSIGKLGEDVTSLLGSFLTTAVQIAAMSRADTDLNLRRDFFVFVDEFRNYATESFTTILSEGRKFRLSLTVANQYLGQLDERTLHALFGNIGSLVCFQVGAKDADLLTEQLGGVLEAQDLMTIPRYHAYVRLLIDGQFQCARCSVAFTPDVPFLAKGAHASIGLTMALSRLPRQ